MTPVHPGEFLLEGYIKPMGISQYRLCKDISVQPRRTNQIVHGDRAITAETALRLSRYFGTSEQFWMNLQARYDLEMEKDRLGDCLVAEVKELGAEEVVTEELPAEEVVDDMGDDQPSSEDTE
ncbi:MAG: HigA family addiction module antidote protein [SAR202 cluster bacterium]|nr:HigA family addiction module antidote protein [SAR202 cluster bacterium]